MQMQINHRAHGAYSHQLPSSPPTRQTFYLGCSHSHWQTREPKPDMDEVATVAGTYTYNNLLRAQQLLRTWAGTRALGVLGWAGERREHPRLGY